MVMKRVSLLLIMVCYIISCSSAMVVENDKEYDPAVFMDEKTASPSYFVLGAGDEISIQVWRHDDLNRSLRIGPTGYIHLPLAGDIQTSGLTIPQLREKITAKLTRFIIEPVVDINVSQYRSSKIHVFGEVNDPGTIVMDSNFSVWEAIAKAGGFSIDANEKKVLLARNQKGVVYVAAIDIELRTGRSVTVSMPPALRNGDILYVAPRSIANIERFMTRLNNIIASIVTLESSIVLSQDVIDIFRGEYNPDNNYIISP